MQSAEFRVQNAECIVQSAEYRVQSAESRTYRYWYPGTRVLSTEVDLIRLRPSLNIVNTLVYVCTINLDR